MEGDSRKLPRGASEEKQSHGDTIADVTITPREGGSFLSESSGGRIQLHGRKVREIFT